MSASQPFTGWAIDRDYIDAGRFGYGQRDAELVATEAEAIIGRRITVETDLRTPDVRDPVRWRVLDDDGEVYYGGAISRAWLDGEDCLAFAPLTFAEADAGAVTLQYREAPDGDWRTL